MAAVSETSTKTEHQCTYNKKLEKGTEIYIKCAKVFESSAGLLEHIAKRLLVRAMAKQAQ